MNIPKDFFPPFSSPLFPSFPFSLFSSRHTRFFQIFRCFDVTVDAAGKPVSVLTEIFRYVLSYFG